MPLAVIGMDHVQITVPVALEAKCLAFYRDLLGSAETAKPVELQTKGGAWFQLANLQLHIGLEPDASPPSKRHVCFLVADVGSARAMIEAAGIPVDKFGISDGRPRFFIRDPAGNRIEIGQR